MTETFIKLPSQALADDRLSHRELRVLMALYSHGANPGDVVWPSRDVICKLTRIKPPHVSVALSRLIDLGWIERRQCGQKANQYTLMLPDVTETVIPEASAEITKTVTPEKRRGYRNGTSDVTDSVPHRTDQEQTICFSHPPKPPKREGDELFARFWAAYPLKRSKGTAERAFAKLKPNEPLLAEILVGLERAKTSDPRFVGGEYIPHPATWLNAKGWQDEAVPVNPKPATSTAYGQSQRTGQQPRNGANHAHQRPDNSAVGKIARSIAERDARTQSAGQGDASNDYIELGSSDYFAVAH
jgi:DNA-binding MarR family transcriptional regulator